MSVCSDPDANLQKRSPSQISSLGMLTILLTSYRFYAFAPLYILSAHVVIRVVPFGLELAV